MTHTRLRPASRITLAALLALATACVQATTYTLAVVPSTPYPFYVTALNNQGLVVGNVDVENFTRHGATWDGQQVRYLTGPLTIAHAYATAVNDAGTVVGESTRISLDGSGNPEIVATRWQGGQAQLWPLAGNSHASAINASGATTVNVYTQSVQQAMVWTGTSLVSLPPFGYPRAYAYGINNAGVVAGTSAMPTDQAVIWENGVLRSLGTIAATPCDTSTAYAVNDTRQVIGECLLRGPRVSFTTRPFVWVDGVMSDLMAGLEGSGSARGQNEQGQIVGDWNGHAMLWDHGRRLDLNDLLDPAVLAAGYELRSARDINEQGQIVAWGAGPGAYSFLLTPVPEPAAAWLLVMGGGGLGWLVRRRLAGPPVSG